MYVIINVYMDLAKKLGWKRKELVLNREGIRLGEVLDHLQDLKSIVTENPDNYIILVNGINIKLLKDFDTEISGDVVVDIFPPAGGGTGF